MMRFYGHAAQPFIHLRGIDRTVTDGFWIIMLGIRGVLGMTCTFGLLVIPVILAYRRFPSIKSPADQILVAALTLIVAIHTLDLLPNGLFSYLPVFFSGALMGVFGKAKHASKRSRLRQRAKRLPHARPNEGSPANSRMVV